MNTRKLRKVLLTLCSALLLVSLSVGMTIAYLTDTTEVVTNTFSVGQVKIKLDEAKVNEDGTPEEGADRVTANSYKLLPGMTYTKDPMVTVEADSEESYVRMLVTIDNLTNLESIFGATDALKAEYYADGILLLQKFVNWDSASWVYEGYTANADGTGTYEFRYKATVTTEDTTAKALEPLFTTLTIPGDAVTDKNIEKLNNTHITVVANAIQAAGFDDADAAWTAFAAQGK